MRSVMKLAALIVIAVLFVSTPAAGVEDTAVWQEFATDLKNRALSVERIRPYEGLSAETILGWLNTLGAEVTQEQLSRVPEMHRIRDHLHCLLVLPEVTYCLTFLVERDTWYFRHIENIFIRLDQIDPLPTSSFPDISEEQKSWIREELYWSQQVYFYGLISAEKGEVAALDLYRDGLGYALAAKTWVPFAEPRKAFILYACWEQSNLRGNGVVLEKLTDDSATIHFPRIQFFEIYEHSIHLREQIPFENYNRIFETIWQDRATNAGWKLRIENSPEGDKVFHFSTRD